MAQKRPLPRGGGGCKEGILTFFWAGVEATLAFRGGYVGVEGARRLHVGHIHMLRGKIRPQRDLSPKSPASQRDGGCTPVSGPTRKVGYLGDKNAP